MKAILLAAGKGERLFPLTKEICKPMIKIAGKPILEYIIEDLERCGFDDLYIIVGYKKEQIINYFQLRNSSKIQFIEQKKFKGTADATFHAKEIVENDDFLLYLSDTIIPNFQQYFNKMLNSQNDIDLISAKIDPSKVSSTGNIEVSENLVTRIIEKPTNALSNLAWAGVSFFKTNYIFELINSQTLSKKGELDITETMNLALEQKLTIQNHTCEKFLDAGTIQGLVDIMKFVLTHRFSSRYTEQYSSQIHSKNPISIGNDCSFGKNNFVGPYVSIGDNVIIGDNVEIQNSLILDNAKINDNAKIKNSIVFNNQILESK